MNKRRSHVDRLHWFGTAAVLLAITLWLGGCATESSSRQQPPAETLPSDFDTGAGKPPTPRTLNSLARILATQGRDAECARMLQRIVYEHPDYLPAYNDLAESYLRMDQTDEAIAVLNAGLKQSPTDPVLNNNLGMCHFLKGEHQQALECFDRAIAAAPRNSSYLANRAAALALLGDEAQARDAYRRILSPADTQANLDILTEAREQLAASDEEIEQPMSNGAESESELESEQVETP